LFMLLWATIASYRLPVDARCTAYALRRAIIQSAYGFRRGELVCDLAIGAVSSNLE